ncbi:hypothetical protein V7S43_001112 [Phytophthora oleae]|uniref:TAZ-type domain-containing protein n=1 Tax=Phytophthora oleae TaxID=2107226 RepID=A0ABD3G8C3_9STRA
MAAARRTGISNREEDIPSLTGMLRASLAESARLLGEFEKKQRGVVDLDVYKQCCGQLASYMAAHMDTSEGFTQHMEKIIDASHRNLEDSVLRSLVPGKLWVQYNGNSDAEANVQTAAVPSTPAPHGPTIKTDKDEDGTVALTPLAVAKASAAGLRPTCSPHVDLTFSTPPTEGRGGKRLSQRGRPTPQESKRARHSVARNLYGAGTLNCEGKEENSETETETEMEGNEKLETQKGSSCGGILWPCSGDNPSVRTVAYKQRLKAAVKLVDAENCCPPVGKVCMQGCPEIRARMCETHRTQGGNAKPCHNGMCCVWREIDTHLVRCQNSQCEFKNVVGLRQAMHDVQQHERRLEATSEKLLAAKTTMRDGFERDSALDARIKTLEKKITRQEDAVLLHKDRKRVFAVDLKDLNIPPVHGGTGELPSFEIHYQYEDL